MSALPYIPLFVESFDAGTKHLSLVEDGAYNRLLRLCWDTPGCTIPAEKPWIMRKMRVSEAEFDAVVGPILDEFFTVKNGRYSQKRLSKEYAISADLSEKRKIAGKIGAAAKHQKTKDLASGNRSGKRQATDKHSTSTLPSLPTGSSGSNGLSDDNPMSDFELFPDEAPAQSKAVVVVGKSGTHFDQWYAGYPRKVARKAGEIAYGKAWLLIAKTGRDPLAVLTDGRDRYARNVAGLPPEKIAHPASWLNGERWNDEEVNHGRPINGTGPAYGRDAKLEQRDARNRDLLQGALEAARDRG